MAQRVREVLVCDLQINVVENKFNKAHYTFKPVGQNTEQNPGTLMSCYK